MTVFQDNQLSFLLLSSPQIAPGPCPGTRNLFLCTDLRNLLERRVQPRFFSAHWTSRRFSAIASNTL